VDRVTPVDVVFVITDVQSTIFLDPIVAELHRRDVTCGLVTNLRGEQPAGDLPHTLTWVVSLPLCRPPSPPHDLWHLTQLTRLIRQARPQVVHASTPKAGLLGTLAGRLARVPCCVYQVRGLRADGARGASRALQLALERLALRAAHQVVFNSPSLRQRMAELGLNPGERGQVVGRGSSIGVDCERFTPDGRPRPGDPPTVGFIGRLHRDKGLDDLLAAHARLRATLPTVRLVVAGDADPTDPSSTELAARLAATPGVELLGHLADVRTALHRIDVLAFPSAREGLPNGPLEAQACGVPVVGYAATGAVDAVEPGTGGLLVPVGDVDALAAALRQVLTDAGLARRLGAGGRRFVEEHFDQRRVVAAHADLLESLLRTR
jgi:glycosyltransferase involved in cell wall biosynthesis